MEKVVKLWDKVKILQENSNISRLSKYIQDSCYFTSKNVVMVEVKWLNRMLKKWK